MTDYRKKIPVVDARQMPSRTDELTARFMMWLGDGAEMKCSGHQNISVSILLNGERVRLKPGDWVVRADGLSRIMTDEAFRADFELASEDEMALFEDQRRQQERAYQMLRAKVATGSLDIDDLTSLEQSTQNVHMQTIHRKPAPTVEELLMQALDTVRAGKARL